MERTDANAEREEDTSDKVFFSVCPSDVVKKGWPTTAKDVCCFVDQDRGGG